MTRYDLTDFAWSVIEPLLPQKSRGVPRVDDRRVLKGIFWDLRSGHALGRSARSLRSSHDLLQPLSPLDQGWHLGRDHGCHDRGLRWRHPDDRRHQRARVSLGGNFKKSHPDRCMGRSRGGLTTKIHAVTDAKGLPIRLSITPGQDHDASAAAALLIDLQDRQIILGDKAYDADWIRRQIEDQGAAPNIPDRSNRTQRHCFSKTLYKHSNLVE